MCDSHGIQFAQDLHLGVVAAAYVSLLSWPSAAADCPGSAWSSLAPLSHHTGDALKLSGEGNCLGRVSGEI